MNIVIRRFKEEDAKKVSEICITNSLEINSKDYPIEKMKKLADSFTEERIINLSKKGHTYVLLVDNEIAGTGSIQSYWDSEEESVLRTIYVDPKFQGFGLGRKIVEVLEEDEYFKKAKRIEVPSSITACKFYKKLGYNYKNGINKLDKEGHYKLEKFNKAD